MPTPFGLLFFLEQIVFILNHSVVKHVHVNLLVLMCRGRFTTSSGSQSDSDEVDRALNVIELRKRVNPP